MWELSLGAVSRGVIIEPEEIVLVASCLRDSYPRGSCLRGRCSITLCSFLCTYSIFE